MSNQPAAAGLYAWFTAFVLLFTYPFLGMLWHHSYPVFSVELAVYLLFAAGLSFGLALLLTRIRETIGYALLIIALVIVAMLHFNLQLEGMLFTVLAGLVLVTLGRDRTPSLMIVVLLALIAGVYFDAGLDQRRNNDFSAEGKANPDLAPVIHLLMDSFAGPAGMPADMSGEATRSRIQEVFTGAGFELYPKAYSRYSSTVDSMTYAFNFGAGEASFYTNDIVTGADHEFNENRYFDELSQHGYRISVYRNEDMDFCQASNQALDACWTYTLPDLDSVRRGVDSVFLRTRLLFNTMLRQSPMIDAMAQKYGLSAPWGIAVYEPEIFDRLMHDIQRRPAGVVYFAHVLFPHSPFAYRSDCGLDYHSTPAERFSRMDGEIKSPPGLLAQRKNLYLAQTECALSVLQAFFEKLRQAGLYDRSFIIVHGDHGAQITRLPMRVGFMEQLERDDYRQAFSVLYAIKPPAGTAAVPDQAVPLEVLLEQALDSIRQYPDAAANNAELDFYQGITAEEPRPHVFLLGTNPMRKVELDLFSESR